MSRTLSVFAVTISVFVIFTCAAAAQQQSGARRRAAGLSSDDLLSERLSSKAAAPIVTGTNAAPTAVSRIAVPAGWFDGAGGYERAVAAARDAGAPLVVYFYADWCSYCRRMDELLGTAEAGEFLDAVVKVRVSPEAGDAETGLAQSYGVQGYPAFFVIAGEGAAPVKVHPFKRGGAQTPRQFADACRRAASRPTASR